MAHPTKLDVMQAKAQRNVYRAVAFLIFASGLSLILYTAPPILQTAAQFYLVTKAQSAAVAAVPSTGKF